MCTWFGFCVLYFFVGASLLEIGLHHLAPPFLKCSVFIRSENVFILWMEGEGITFYGWIQNAQEFHIIFEGGLQHAEMPKQMTDFLFIFSFSYENENLNHCKKL